MTAQTGGRRFDSHEGRFRVALQPILNGGNLCFVNCDANIISNFKFQWYIPAINGHMLQVMKTRTTKQIINSQKNSHISVPYGRALCAFWH